MALVGCGSDCFSSAELAADGNAPGIAYGVIVAFVPTAYMESAPLSTSFFLPHDGFAVFADHHFRAWGCAALRLPVGVPASSGRVIPCCCTCGSLAYPQES